MKRPLKQILTRYRDQFTNVVPFDQEKDKLLAIDLGGNNSNLTPAILNDTALFSDFINNALASADSRYAIGGYLENRVVYSRSALFNNTANTAKNRTMHLGIDIWGPAGTPVFAPVGGTVHSFAFNDRFGDYGATIILQHQLEGVTFHTLYGHVSLADLSLGQNQYIHLGEQFARFGTPKENGNWPPHLHFQVIADMELKEGDYPGVCAPADIDYYRKNCPDPDLILNLRKLAVQPVHTF